MLKRLLYALVLLVATCASCNADNLRLVRLRYMDANHVAELIRGQSGVAGTTVVNSSILIVWGGDEVISKTLPMIEKLDSPASMARPIRLKIEVKSTLTKSGKHVRSYQSSASSVGADREPLILRDNVMVPYTSTVTIADASGKLVEKPRTHYLAVQPVSASLTPIVIDKAGSRLISLTGDAGFDFAETDASHVKKTFNVSQSIPPGEATQIASGSEYLPDGKLDYVMTVTAVIEEGTVVPFQANQQSSGFGGGYGGQRGISSSGFGVAP